MELREAHQRALDLLLSQLRQSLTLASLAATSDSPTGETARDYFAHTIQRAALAYGRGTYENLSTSAIFATVIHTEALLHYEYIREAATNALHATEHARQGDEHLARAKALASGVTRAQNLGIGTNLPTIDPYRGVYIYPTNDTVEQMLVGEREYFMRWRDGVVAIIPESEIPAYAATGARIAILFYSADDLLNIDTTTDPDLLPSLFQKRWDDAQANPQSVGDAFHRYIAELLLQQSIHLFHLLERTEAAHPIAHRYYHPLVQAHTERFLTHLQNHPVWQAEPPDPITAFRMLIPLEAEIVAHITATVTEAEGADPAGLLGKFEAIHAIESYEKHLSDTSDNSAFSFKP